jgi:adenosylcobinamide kinase / adenosylcobinamide-phosphate guanylyltransferase
MMTLVLGGARSGKSRYAQSLFQSSSRVIYIATAHVDTGTEDNEMRARIERHRADRPMEWQTVEEPFDISRVISEAPVETSLLIDCATIWISNLMWKFKEETAAERHNLILTEIENLIGAVWMRADNSVVAADVVIVSNEIGSSLVPEHPVAREFRDLQGFANQRLAQAAHRVVFIIAGLPLMLKPDARCWMLE